MTLMITLDPFADAPQVEPERSSVRVSACGLGKGAFWGAGSPRKPLVELQRGRLLSLLADGCAHVRARSISSRHWENETELAPTLLLCFKRGPAQPHPALEGAQMSVRSIAEPNYLQ